MIRCSEVMTHLVQYCAPDESAKEVADIMNAAGVGCIPVVEYESKHLLGIITDRDLAMKIICQELSPKETRADEIMNRRLITCTPETPLDEAMRLMDEYQLRRIPVVDQDNRLVGIISLADIAVRIPTQAVELLVSVLKSRKAVQSSK